MNEIKIDIEYAQVSTDEQERNGYSIEFQKEKLKNNFFSRCRKVLIIG